MTEDMGASAAPTGPAPQGAEPQDASQAKPLVPCAAPEWELCMNPTSPQELSALSKALFDASHSMSDDEELERRINFSCNPMMDGDGGWMFMRSHRGALRMIANMLSLRAAELDRLRPSYCVPASGMSASGQDPKGLEAKPASPTSEAGDAQGESA